MTSKRQFDGERVKLGDCLLRSFSGEWGKAEGDTLIPVLRTANFNDDGTFDYSTPAMRCIPESKIEKKRLQRGDVVLEKSGGTPNRPVGILAYYDSDDLALCSNFNHVLRFDVAKIDSRFAFYQLRWLKAHGAFEPCTRKTTGLQNLQMSSFASLELKALSLGTQAECSNSLHAIETQIRGIKRGIAMLDTLVKSRFVEMFGDPVRQPKWPVKNLGELCSKLGSGATPRGGKSAYKEQGTPLIRSMNVHNGIFVWDDLAFIDEGQAKKLQNATLERGDVLLNITGASVARSCILPDELEGGRVNQHVAIVRADKNVLLPCVLNATLINDSYQQFLLEGSRMAGATREAITKQDLKNMHVPVPPLSLQQQFADFVTKVDKPRFVAQRQIEKLQMLYDSLAQEYFG